MVYCGKPSKGCENCRKKRTRCDLNRPSCGQCRRTGRVCLGYRDEATLTFRDQSDLTASKFQLVSTKEQTPPKGEVRLRKDFIPPIEDELDLEEFALLPVKTAIPPWAPNVPPDVQAISFFFSNYVYEDPSFKYGYNAYLPEVFGSTPSESPLMSVVASIGFAGIGNQFHDPNARAVSASRYTMTIRSINEALRDPARATSDETLITIFLMGLYETNTGRTPKSLKSWGEHVNGAMTLLSMRGKEQLQSRIGLALFSQLRSHIILGCMARRTAPPPHLIAWSRLARKYSTTHKASGFGSDLADFGFRFCQFRVDEMDPKDEYRNPHRVIEFMSELDDGLSLWNENFQSNFAYTTVHIEERSEEVFSDHYHLYPTLLMAVMWNHYRSTRILVHDILIQQIAVLYHKTYLPTIPLPHVNTALHQDVEMPEDFVYANQFRKSHAMLTTLAHDICASVPYYFNYHTHGSRWQEDQNRPVSVKGNVLIWPLYAAGSITAASPVLRRWVISKMKKIGEIIGIKQSSLMAGMLEKNQYLGMENRSGG